MRNRVSARVSAQAWLRSASALGAFAALLASSIAADANAQAWPPRPIRLVVPYPPGASTDIVARSVAQKIAEPLGQPIVIDNRGGASSSIGLDYVAKSAADGYTFMIGTDATHASNVHLGRNFPYDPVRDFTAITAAVANIIVLVVHSGVPANSVAALIEPNRYAALPQIPTIGETVRGFELTSWLGFFAPAGLPAPILARLSTEIVKALRSDDLRSKFEPAGLAVIANSPDEFAAMVKAGTEERGRLIKAAGIQPE